MNSSELEGKNILFYSDHEPASKQILDILEKSPLLNEQFYKFSVNNPNIKIPMLIRNLNVVPVIAVSGFNDLIKGPNAVEWVKNNSLSNAQKDTIEYVDIGKVNSFSSSFSGLNDTTTRSNAAQMHNSDFNKGTDYADTSYYAPINDSTHIDTYNEQPKQSFKQKELENMLNSFKNTRQQDIMNISVNNKNELNDFQQQQMSQASQMGGQMGQASQMGQMGQMGQASQIGQMGQMGQASQMGGQFPKYQPFVEDPSIQQKREQNFQNFLRGQQQPQQHQAQTQQYQAQTQQHQMHQAQMHQAQTQQQQQQLRGNDNRIFQDIYTNNRMNPIDFQQSQPTHSRQYNPQPSLNYPQNFNGQSQNQYAKHGPMLSQNSNYSNSNTTNQMNQMNQPGQQKQFPSFNNMGFDPFNSGSSSYAAW